MFLADANLRVTTSAHVRLRVAVLERLVFKALLDMAREARGEVVSVTTAAVLGAPSLDCAFRRSTHMPPTP